MGLEIKIIINDRFPYERESKRYRSTPEQIQQNRREIAVQRERDERAREEANRNTNTNATHNK
jgi:hypothetical protein